MDFLKTMQDANKAVKELNDQLATIEHYSTVMRRGGHGEVIPFSYNPHDEEDPMVKRYAKYNALAHELLENMKETSVRMPTNQRYANLLGWAMAFDGISKK